MGDWSDAAAGLALRWPPPQGSGARVRVWISLTKLAEHTRLRLLDAEERPLLDLWHPRITGDSGTYRGWVSVVLPRDLAPSPGSTPLLVAIPLLEDEAVLARILEVRVEGLDLPKEAPPSP